MTITPDGFRAQMQTLADGTDTERTHSEADDLMAKVLRSLGYGEGIDVYESMGKWYS